MPALSTAQNLHPQGLLTGTILNMASEMSCVECMYNSNDSHWLLTAPVGVQVQLLLWQMQIWYSVL